MNDKELIGKIHSAIYHQCQRRGYAAPVDVMMEIGVLPKQKYEDWRFGRVDYLERVCTVNWGVKKKNRQGHKPVIPLRFSKSGDPEIERRYATHFVDTKQVERLKERQNTEKPD